MIIKAPSYPHVIAYFMPFKMKIYKFFFYVAKAVKLKLTHSLRKNINKNKFVPALMRLR